MSSAEIEVLPPLKHGGRREGSGRKKGYSPKKAEAMMRNQNLFGDEPPPPGASAQDPTGEYVDYAKERARKERALADMAELEYNIKSKRYVARSEVRQVSATVYATIAQNLRSLPDVLERELALDPDECERVVRIVDEGLAKLAKELKSLGEQDGE